MQFGRPGARQADDHDRRRDLLVGNLRMLLEIALDAQSVAELRDDLLSQQVASHVAEPGVVFERRTELVERGAKIGFTEMRETFIGGAGVGETTGRASGGARVGQYVTATEV